MCLVHSILQVCIPLALVDARQVLCAVQELSGRSCAVCGVCLLHPCRLGWGCAATGGQGLCPHPQEDSCCYRDHDVCDPYFGKCPVL